MTAEVLTGTGTSVGSLFTTTAARVPDREALVFLPDSPGSAAERRMTYAELLAAAQRVSGYLGARLESGTRVAVWARNAPDWLLLQLGTYLAGLVLVPMNPTYGRDEAEYVLRTAEVGALFHDRAPGEVADLSRTLGIGLCRTLAEAEVQWREAEPSTREVAASAVAQVQFTSGTTGRPKGTLLTHAGLTTTPVIASRCLGLGDGARWLNVTPLFHIGGSILPVLGCLALGATHVLGERYSADRVLATFGAERISFFGGVPTMWWDLLERHDPDRHSAAALEVLMTGGAPVPDDLVRRVQQTFGAHIVVAYGQTEAHGHITQTHMVGAGVPDPGNTGASAIGRPLPHTAVRIVRPDGTTADPGEPGELVATSPTLMLGYLGRAEDTARALDADGALHTGDVCSMDEGGVVSFVGRLSELIVRGGEKVAPAEIEAALATHPRLARVAVAGVPDDRLGERIAAFVVPVGAAPTPDELIEFLRPRLARYKIPEIFEFVTELPLAPTGKVAKGALVEALVSQRARTPAGT